MHLVAKLKSVNDISHEELRLTFKVYDDSGGNLIQLSGADAELMVPFNPDSMVCVDPSSGVETNRFTQDFLDAEVGAMLEQIEKELNPPVQSSGKSDLSQIDLTIGAGARIIKQRKIGEPR